MFKRSARLKVSPTAFFLILFLCLLIAWIVYVLLGHKIVQAMYEGNSAEILNRVIEGQDSYNINYYFRKADRLARNLLKIPVFVALFFYLLTRNWFQIIRNIHRISFYAGLVFLVYFFGIVSAEARIWPYPIFKRALVAGRAWYEKLKPKNRYETGLYHRATHRKGGVFRYNKSKVYDGYTLFSSGHDNKALLMSMDGDIIYDWHIPFSMVWPNPPHIKYPTQDRFICVRKAHLFRNGDLLAIYESVTDTPYGYGLVKVDKDSNIIWKYSGRVHHDLDIDDHGKIYTLTHEIINKEFPEINVKRPFIDNHIVILDPDGLEIDRVSITDLFSRSDYAHVLRTLKTEDIWHTNNIELLDKELADKFPMFKEGDVILSFNNATGIIAVADLKEKKIIWISDGTWGSQHDTDFLENGNILLFNNGNFRTKGRSSIIELNPNTEKIVWQYWGRRQDPFFSRIRGSQQRLPNGNTLITETDNGRIFEVTKTKKVVWEYLTPYRHPDKANIVAVVMWAHRFGKDELTFLKDLSK